MAERKDIISSHKTDTPARQKIVKLGSCPESELLD